MSAITAKASRKMKKYAVLTREPRCFLGSFDFSWEQRKAIDIADYSKGNGYSKGDLTDAGTPIILYGRLYTKYQFAISEVDTFAVPRNGAVYSQGNEVIVPASGETAEDIARASAVEKSGVLLGGDLNILRPFDFINPLFLALAISNGEPQKELAKKAQGKSVVHIHNTDIQEVTIAYPSRTEQDRIVSVFRQLDNLITLHQRKCVFLFGFFQAFISMIFTASTFSWEQRKFSDITFPAGEKNKDNLPLESYSITNEHGFVPQDEKFENGGTMREADKRMYYIVSPNSFAYNPARINVGSIGYQNIGKNVIVSSLYEVFKTSEDVDDRLLWHWFKSPDFQKLIMQLQEGGVRLYFYYDKLCMGEVSLPSLEEQRKIGKLFDTLDNLITLHQRECISFTARAGRLILTANKKRNTSSWEQRKLSEMCGTFEYGLNAAAKEFDGKNKYIRITDIDDASREFLLSDLSSPDICLDGMSKYLLSSGDIVFARTGASVGKTYIYRENDGIVYFAGFLIRAKVKQDNNAEFVFQSTLSPSYEKYIRITSQRSGQPGVNAQEYGEYDLFAPSKEEQQRIGHFLQGIDNLITLHQRKPFIMKWRTSDANRNQTNRLVL